MGSVLVLSDDNARCRRLAGAVRGGNNGITVHCATRIADALEIVAALKPTLAAVTLEGPPTRTLATVETLHRHAPRMGILVAVPADLPLVAQQAMARGASDCLKRPVSDWEWSHRSHALLRASHQRCLLSAALRRNGLQQHRQARQADPLLAVLTSADTLHDAVTGHHERRTGQLAGQIAAGLGLPQKECDTVARAAALHDIGKIGVRDAILRKPGQYTAAERAIMGHHPRMGYEILRHGTTPELQTAAEIALNHHERIDGSGYPCRLSGPAIPLPARITAVADVFDAIASSRPYHPAMATEEACEFIRRSAGTHFDRDCVDALLARASEALAIVTG